MKRILPLFIACITFLSTTAQTKFFEGTWKEAAAEAKLQNKYLFVDCFTDWCYWCKVADKETFPNSDVGEFLNSNFVSVQVDMERGDGVYLGMKYRVIGYPSFLVFSPEGQLVLKTFGYMQDTKQFIATLSQSFDLDLRPAYPSLITDYVEFPEFYQKTYKVEGNESVRKAYPKLEEVDAWLSKQDNLYSEVVWSVMYKFEFGEKFEEIFLENRDVYAKIYGSSEVTDKIESIAHSKLKYALKSLETKDLDAALEFAFKYSERDEELKTSYLISFFEAKEDWKSYATQVEIAINRNGYEKFLDQINSYSWNIYLNVGTEEKAVLLKAVGWMSKVVAEEPNFFYLDTYAALLYKCSHHKLALDMAEKAILAGKNDEADVTETEELKKKILMAIEGK